MTFSRRWTLAPLVLAVLLVPAGAHAQLSKFGGLLQMASGGTSYARAADTGYDSTHDVYLTVTTEHQTSRVFGTFVTGAGVASAGFRIDTTSNYPFGPSVTYSPQADVFLVTWVNESGQVRGRLVRYGTGVLGAGDVLLGSGARGTWSPAVAYSPTSEEFLLSWSSSAGPNWIVRVSTAATVIGAPVQTTGAVWTQEPALAWNPGNNQFVLVYAQEMNPGWQVRLQRVSQGALVGGYIIVHAAGSTKQPDVQYSTESGKFLVCWFQGSPYGIYSRLLNTDGSPAAAVQPLLPSTYGSYDANSLSYNAFTGTFIVASVTSQNSLDTIGGAEVSSLGVPSTAWRFVDAPAGTGNRRYPRTAASSENNKFNLVFNKSLGTFWGQMFTSGGGGGEPPPPPPGGSLSLTGLSPSPTLPAQAGTPITWTAAATGSTTVEYQYWLYSGASGQWTVSRAWAASNTHSWTPPSAGQYAVQVWARLQGTTDYLALSSGFFNITSPSSPTGTLTLTGLTPSPAVPVGAGTAITWTGAASVSGGGTPEYQFWVYSGATSQWVVARPWSAGNNFTWTPATAGQYAVQVWARLQGTTPYQARSSGFFTVTSVVPPTGSLTLTGLISNPAPPVTPGSTMTFTGLATVNGGGTAEYQFWLYSAATAQWVVGRPWAESNTFTWTPTTAGTYAVQVWARLEGTTPYQYATSGFFSVSGTASETTRVTITNFTVSPGAPFTTSTSQTWSADATGAASIEYAYWVYSSVTQSWTQARGYQGTKTFTWSPTVPGSYAVQVWARRVGSLLAYEDYKGTGFFTVY